MIKKLKLWLKKRKMKKDAEKRKKEKLDALKKRDPFIYD